MLNHDIIEISPIVQPSSEQIKKLISPFHQELKLTRGLDFQYIKSDNTARPWGQIAERMQIVTKDLDYAEEIKLWSRGLYDQPAAFPKIGLDIVKEWLARYQEYWQCVLNLSPWRGGKSIENRDLGFYQGRTAVLTDFLVTTGQSLPLNLIAQFVAVKNRDEQIGLRLIGR